VREPARAVSPWGEHYTAQFKGNSRAIFRGAHYLLWNRESRRENVLGASVRSAKQKSRMSFCGVLTPGRVS